VGSAYPIDINIKISNPLFLNRLAPAAGQFPILVVLASK
jgi:hypothetical protein